MEYYYTNMQEKLLHAGHGQNETIQGIVLLDRYYMMAMAERSLEEADNDD